MKRRARSKYEIYQMCPFHCSNKGVAWPLFPLFVKNAYLYGDLQEEVYQHVSGFDNYAKKANVCRLHQAIVGLKQALRAWFAKLEEAMQTGGFRTKAESALFIK